MEKETTKRLLERLLDFEKLKYCYECGTCTASCPVVELVSQHYNPRILLQKVFLDLERVITESEPWLCAWCYRCYESCPQGIKLPEILSSIKSLAVEQGRLQGFKKAIELIEKEIPLPAVCSRVCFHPERSKIGEPLIMDMLRRFVVDYELKKSGPIPKEHKERIAIIGSGPAGLVAAYELVWKGYPVTVFESLPEPGGMLRVGVPEYRLPKDLLDAEIKYIEKLGIEIRTNTAIGKDLTVDDLLREGYKAVFIAIGAHESRKLRIRGEELGGVIHALHFLKEINLGRKVKLGDRVAVIGGGNTAMDSARTALRLGAKEVTILYRRSREEMPANPWEVKEAEEEGVKIQFLAAPKRILGKEGRVTAVECIQMRLGELDESGRRRPVPIEGSEFIIDLDTVIVAIGESPNLSFLPEGIEVTQNAIAVDPVTLETSLPGVFAGGDVVSGPATVIEAIAAGKRAALSIDCYLRGEYPSQ